MTRLVLGHCNWMWRCAGHSQSTHKRGWKGTTSTEYSVSIQLSTVHASNLHVCVSTGMCVFPRVGNTPDEKEKAQGSPGTNFPSLFQRPVHYCKQEGTILHGPPTSFAAIFLHSPSFLLKHNSVPPRLPTVHHCMPVKPRLVAMGSPKFQSCHRCLECFLSLSIFHLSCFQEWK